MTDTLVPTTRQRFPGISSRAYEHPADRSALVAMRSVPGFDAVLRKLSGLFRERAHRYLFLASAIRASDRQFSGVWALHREGSATLDLEDVPELFIRQHPEPWALTLGMDRPFVVITTGMVDLLDEDELRYVVGHELGHVLSGHAVYRTMLWHLTRVALQISWFPVGALGLRAIIAALNEWFRKSELSCDRAGLLVGQDRSASLRALMKMAGGARLHEMEPDEFLDQAREYQASGDVRDSVIKLLNLEGRSHPFEVMRALELELWVDDGGYQAILDGDYPRREDDPRASFRDEVKAAASSYRERFEQSSDPLVKFVKDVGGDVAAAGERLYQWVNRRGDGGDRPGDDQDPSDPAEPS